MLSKKIKENLDRSSWIRAMFEEGEKLRGIHGADKVFDFTLGNPDTEPPDSIRESYKKLINGTNPGIHRYMNNAGFVDVREAVASQLRKESGVDLAAEHIVMTCGAAGGLNVVLKAILNPGDEVIILAPYFVEYMFYIDNHGGRPVVVNTSAKDFQPDAEEIAAAVTAKTKAVIINSPNNPTGVVYSKQALQRMATALAEKEKEFNSTIYVISDEPYSKIFYEDTPPPHILDIFKNSFMITSFSKSLSLPGERIGYIAANPPMASCKELVDGLVFCNRTLGFVNAPALAQKVIAGSLDEGAAVGQYKEKRDILYEQLVKLGFSCIKPEGAFYFFPQALIPDDVEFAKKALKYNLLLVPGKGFGWPGCFRISYCVSMKTIKDSFPAFEALVSEIRG